MTEHLNERSIYTALRGAFGRPCRVFDELPSTQAEAMNWAIEGAPEGALVVADHQSAGRGRRGRSWFSEPGASLLFSLVLRPPTTFERLGLLSTALGVAIADALERLIDVPARLKWPNDVTVRGKKIAGILVETKLSGAAVDVAIAGIGLNLRAPDAYLPPDLVATATGLEVEASPSPSRVELLGEILASIENAYERALSPATEASIVDDATRLSDILGSTVVIRLPNGEFIGGVARRLLLDGALEIEVDGGLRRVTVGEVEQLRTAPR